LKALAILVTSVGGALTERKAAAMRFRQKA